MQPQVYIIHPHHTRVCVSVCIVLYVGVFVDVYNIS